MTQPGCEPIMGVVPLPCRGGGEGSPGEPGDLLGCCSPSLTSTLLCQADDCSPVSLVVRQGCATCGDPSGDPLVVGWLDAAGAFTAGAPPAGLVACDGCSSPGEDCAVPRCQGFIGAQGPEEWTPPPGTESVNLNVVCAPVVVYPCTGATDGVTINECGSVAFGSPGEPCTPGELCPQFRIEIPPGSSAYIAWIQAGCEGEVSP